MALRTEDIPTVGVPLFHVTDFGRWERVGRLRGIRYCCVTCAYCNGVACVIFRPDFVKATQTARVYDPALARQIDQRCHTCAVRVQWKNQSARIYLCYPQMNLIDCLKAKRDSRAEIVDLKRAPHRTTNTQADCLCTFPKSHFHMFPTTRNKSGKVVAERYGDETRMPRPAFPSSPRRRKRKRPAATSKPAIPVIATAEWKLNALKQILEATNGTPLLVTALPLSPKMKE